VSRAISSVAGVKDVQVSFADDRADVTSTRCGEDAASEIAEALSEAGYGGEVLSTGPAPP